MFNEVITDFIFYDTFMSPIRYFKFMFFTAYIFSALTLGVMMLFKQDAPDMSSNIIADIDEYPIELPTLQKKEMVILAEYNER